MGNFLKNFARGAIQGGEAVTGAILEGLRQEKEAKLLEQRAKSQGILDSLNEARIDELKRGKPKELVKLEHGYAPDGSEYTYNPETGETQYSGQKYNKPEKATESKKSFSIKTPSGMTLQAPTIEELKQQAADAHMTMTEWQNLMKPPVEDTKPMTQQQIARTKRDLIDVTTQEKLADGTPNPYYQKGDSLLQDWMGEVAPLLQGPQAPAVAGQLPFMPPQKAPVQAADPEIEKARQALSAGQITQEQYDRFVKERMGQ